MEEENQVVEETTETDNSTNVVEEEQQIEEVVEPQTELTVDDYRKLEATNKKLYARLKMEEAKAKELEGKVNLKPIINQDTVSRDELVLIAKGKDVDVIDKAKLIAQASGISLIDALQDPAIVAFEEKKLQEEKSKQAQLGGSGRTLARKEPEVKPNMPRDEHKALVEKAMNLR